MTLKKALSKSIAIVRSANKLCFNSGPNFGWVTGFSELLKSNCRVVIVGQRLFKQPSVLGEVFKS